MGELLEIRKSGAKSHLEIRAQIADGSRWPKEGTTGFSKTVISGSVVVNLHGLEGDEAGDPIHVADSFNRGALVVHEDMYKYLKEHFPGSAATLVRGGLAENFVVNDPSLLPSVVCVGDKFQIGSAIFHVSGARQACPKIDAWHNAHGMTAMVVANGWAGYFLRVEQVGEVCAGDKIILLSRPHPGWTIERISRGLWGSAEQIDNSREFLTYVSSIDVLIPRHFKETAALRLERLNEDENKTTEAASTKDVPVAKDAASVAAAPVVRSAAEREANAKNTQMYLMALFVALVALFLYTQFVPLRKDAITEPDPLLSGNN